MEGAAVVEHLILTFPVTDTMTRTRVRFKDGQLKQIGKKTTVNFGKPRLPVYYNSYYGGSHETTTDEIHPNHPHSGGPFSSQKFYTTFVDSSGKHGYSYKDPYKRLCEDLYVGTYHLPATQLSLPTELSSEAADLGATAWKRFKPAKPVVSGSVFLAELREAPQLVVRQLLGFKKLGNAYLAYQFGWKPFLNDLRDWCDSISKTDRYINQLRRNNGRRIRRGGVLFEEKTDTITTSSAIGVQPQWRISDREVVETTRTKTCWFKGSFRYYIPGLESQKWGRLRGLSKMWDLEMGPEQIYQLIPFSWLGDWFSNLGDVVSNFASSLEDNLTAQYAYVMLSDITRVTKSAFFTTSFQDKYATAPVYTDHYCQSVSNLSSKTRVAANPYGFNVGFDGLDAYQTSILTALGMSKLKF